MTNMIDDFAAARLGDPRRVRRLVAMASALWASPGASFPDVFRGSAALEGCYRFLNNCYISLARLLQPHVDATVRRCVGHRDVAVVHDTSEFEFQGDVRREGLGRLNYAGRQGFYAHVALGVAVDGAIRNPLGVLGTEMLVRTGPAKGKRTPAQLREDPDNEQRRWMRLVEKTDSELRPQGVSAIHLMDREGDAFENFLALRRGKHRFVIRAAHDRAIESIDDATSVFAAVQKAQGVIEREATVTLRKPHSSPRQRKSYPPRQERIAKLAFAAMPVRLKRPKHALRSVPKFVELNVVHVWEVDCPVGEEPIEWVLFTSEPIDTPTALARIVDLYRARWVIEEFFKALKTGCALEKRQLESKHAIFNAFGLFVPIAVQLLRVRWYGRGTAANTPATEVLTPTLLDALRAMQPAEGQKWSVVPTTREVMLTIAAAGGHIKNNGEPGWLVLGRGYVRFLDFAAGWEAAQKPAPEICDQS